MIVIDKLGKPYPTHILRTNLLSNSSGDLGRGKAHAGRGWSMRQIPVTVLTWENDSSPSSAVAIA